MLCVLYCCASVCLIVCEYTCICICVCLFVWQCCFCHCLSFHFEWPHISAFVFSLTLYVCVKFFECLSLCLCILVNYVRPCPLEWVCICSVQCVSIWSSASHFCSVQKGTIERNNVLNAMCYYKMYCFSVFVQCSNGQQFLTSEAMTHILSD